VLDYFDPDQPEIQIEIPEGTTLKEAASDYFARYQKSRRALAAIESRERDVSRKLARLKELVSKLEEPTSVSIGNIRKDLDQLLEPESGRVRPKARGRIERRPILLGEVQVNGRI
jgi:hypothetical protein